MRMLKEERTKFNYLSRYNKDIKELVEKGVFKSVTELHKTFEENKLIQKFGKFWVVNKYSELPYYSCREYLTTFFFTPGGSDGYYGKQAIVFIRNDIFNKLVEGKDLKDIMSEYETEVQTKKEETKNNLSDDNKSLFNELYGKMENRKLNVKVFKEYEFSKNINSIFNWFLRKNLIEFGSELVPILGEKGLDVNTENMHFSEELVKRFCKE